MSTKLQQYKRALSPRGHKNIRTRKTTTLTFDQWLLPTRWRRDYLNTAYAHNLINSINIPLVVAVAEVTRA